MWKKVAIVISILLFTSGVSYSITLSEYRDEMRDTIKELEVLSKLDPKSWDFQRRINAIELPSHKKIIFDDRQLTIDSSWFWEALDKIKREEDGNRRKQLIEELKEGLVTLESEIGDEAREWVNPKPYLLKILNGMELQRQLRRLCASPYLLLLIILRWLKELLREWGLLKIALYSLYLFIPLIMAGIVVYILKKVKFRTAKRIEEEIPTEVAKGSKDPNQLRGMAEDYATKGDYRMAIRYLYLTLLLWLDKIGIIDYDSTKTNGEYLRAIQEKVKLYQSFLPLTRLFDEVWYGTEPVNLPLYQEFYRNYTEAQERLQR